MKQKKIRVLLAKVGLDGHDRGILLVAMALRDAGMEVIYTGRHQSPQQVARAAIQEDVDVIGLSSLSDAHRVLAPKLVTELRKQGRGDIPVILGGFIQNEDIPDLEKEGRIKVAPRSANLEAIVGYFRSLASKVTDAKENTTGAVTAKSNSRRRE